MVTVVLYAASIIAALIVGGGLVIGVSRGAIIDLQGKAIRARDTTIKDLQAQLTKVSTEHQAQIDQNRDELADLRRRVQQLVTEGVEKDGTIGLLLRKVKSMEADAKRVDLLRASCPMAGNCPLDRRKNTRRTKAAP